MSNNREPLYCVVFTGDGACASLVRGFDAMVKHVGDSMYGDFAELADQRRGMEESLRDDESWSKLGDEAMTPFRFYEGFEDGSLCVTLVTDEEKEAAHVDA